MVATTILTGSSGCLRRSRSLKLRFAGGCRGGFGRVLSMCRAPAPTRGWLATYLLPVRSMMYVAYWEEK